MKQSQAATLPTDGSPFPYRLYFDEMPAYCSVQDRQLRIIDCNRRFRNDFGEGIGRYCYELYKKRSDKCPDCPVEKTCEDGQSYGSEELLLTAAGDEIPVIVYTRPVRDAEGNVVAVMEMGTDITSVKMLDQLKKEDALNQVANVAQLPGIVKASMAMPDIHWGYGFPIGGVAAFDWQEGVVSPGPGN